MKETKNKHVLELPREVLKASGLANGQELGALSLDGVVLLTRDSMPIVDLLQMLDTLHRYAAAMLTQIAVECGPCEKADESLTAEDVLEFFAENNLSLRALEGMLGVYVSPVPALEDDDAE